MDVNCKACTLAGVHACAERAAGAGDACLQSISRAVVTYSPHRRRRLVVRPPAPGQHKAGIGADSCQTGKAMLRGGPLCDERVTRVERPLY